MLQKKEKIKIKFDTTVNLTNLIGALVISASIVSSWVSMDKRINKNELGIFYLANQQKKDEERLEQTRIDIKSDSDSMGRKLDRFIEKFIGSKN